jgi:hypothetical protein
MWLRVVNARDNSEWLVNSDWLEKVGKAPTGHPSVPAWSELQWRDGTTMLVRVPYEEMAGLLTGPARADPEG